MNKNSTLLPANWDAKQAADHVLKRLFNICGPGMRGAHDADFVIVNHKAYIVYEANNIRPGENAGWHDVYAAMSIVDIKTSTVEKIIQFAASGTVYENETLPIGACFVPRIIQKDNNTLRCFFASENPGNRESQTWFIDFNIERAAFHLCIYRAKLKTVHGIFEMQPLHFYHHAVSKGFSGKQQDFGLYIIDSFKVIDQKIYAVLNNFIVGHNALTVLNEEMDTFEVLGDYIQPGEMKLTESAVNRLPDGSWLAISRQETGNQNYVFSHSDDGRYWSIHDYHDHVTNGTNSKPTFDKFNAVYYLGWQEATRAAGVFRSVFNIDVSADCSQWERKYRFESINSFQYPRFCQDKGHVYLAVTQGDSSDIRKERIMFGKLEP